MLHYFLWTFTTTSSVELETPISGVVCSALTFTSNPLKCLIFQKGTDQKKKHKLRYCETVTSTLFSLEQTASSRVLSS
jgi:hypothetical protein